MFERLVMRVALPLKILLASLALGAAIPAQAAQCVLMSYFDQNGAVIQTPEPVIAMVVGGAPMVEEGMPTHYSAKQGPEVPCPAKLVDSIRAVFNRSCPSEGSRNQAAKDNKTKVEEINTGCGNMLKALQPPAPVR